MFVRGMDGTVPFPLLEDLLVLRPNGARQKLSKTKKPLASTLIYE